MKYCLYVASATYQQNLVLADISTQSLEPDLKDAISQRLHGEHRLLVKILNINFQLLYQQFDQQNLPHGAQGYWSSDSHAKSTQGCRATEKTSTTVLSTEEQFDDPDQGYSQLKSVSTLKAWLSHEKNNIIFHPKVLGFTDYTSGLADGAMGVQGGRANG